LNQAPGDYINRQKPIAADANIVILLPLSGHSGHSKMTLIVALLRDFGVVQQMPSVVN
jgi:hypothetical protein